jgi:chitosanase
MWLMGPQIAALVVAAATALTPAQKHVADELISLFENDTPAIQYCYIEDIHDGRGYTAGRAGFTTATSDLLEVVERYTRAVPDNPLAPFLPRLREVNGSDDISGLEGLTDAWKEACADPRFRGEQDAVVDDEYYLPALKKARGVGLRLPLSIAQLYDAEIQMGGGDDPDGTPAMIKETTRKAHGTPRRHQVAEKTWLKTFLAVRRRHLRHAADPATREAWRDSVYRVDVFDYLVKKGQWKLKTPLRIKTSQYDITLR